MLRPYVRRDLDPEQVRRLPFREPFEPLAAPEQRSLGELVHEPVAHAELACQVLDVALRGEEAVRTTLDDEAVRRSVTITPPGRRPASSTITSTPPFSSSHAAASPASPAPTTTHVTSTPARRLPSARDPRALPRAVDRRSGTRCARAGRRAAPRAPGTSRRRRTGSPRGRTRTRTGR